MHLTFAFSKQDRAWKFAILLLVLIFHAWLGWTLAHFRPSGQRTPTEARDRNAPPEPLLVLDFRSRVDPPAGPSVQPAARARPRPRRGIAAPDDASGAADAAEPGRRTPLNLQAPPSPRLVFSRPELLDRRVALAHEATRFDHAWVSDGNLTEVVARRSRIAAALLGALGALSKPCTRSQLEQLDAACVPDQYRPPGPAH